MCNGVYDGNIKTPVHHENKWQYDTWVNMVFGHPPRCPAWQTAYNGSCVLWVPCGDILSNLSSFCPAHSLWEGNERINRTIGRELGMQELFFQQMITWWVVGSIFFRRRELWVRYSNFRQAVLCVFMVRTNQAYKRAKQWGIEGRTSVLVENQQKRWQKLDLSAQAAVFNEKWKIWGCHPLHILNARRSSLWTRQTDKNWSRRDCPSRGDQKRPKMDKKSVRALCSAKRCNYT